MCELTSHNKDDDVFFERTRVTTSTDSHDDDSMTIRLSKSHDDSRTSRLVVSFGERLPLPNDKVSVQLTR